MLLLVPLQFTSAPNARSFVVASKSPSWQAWRERQRHRTAGALAKREELQAEKCWCLPTHWTMLWPAHCSSLSTSNGEERQPTAQQLAFPIESEEHTKVQSSIHRKLPAPRRIQVYICEPPLIPSRT